MRIKKVIDTIQQGKRFLITAHVNLEGDALGAELAMYGLLRRLGKKVTIFNSDPTPVIYKFLPYSQKIKNNFENALYDVAMVLDCSDSSRTGRVKDYLGKAQCIVNIDHHISNTLFGDVNWVDAKASSACQILYQLCERMKIMDRNIALCLYTGIFTDTGKFTYTNTSAKTHWVVSQLMKYRIDPYTIYENLHSHCVPSDLRFMGQIISSLKFDSNKKICWAVIRKWEEREYDLTEIIFSIMRFLKGVEVFILFKKIGKNKIRVNLRSRHRVDVNKVAQFFGGGGHKRASGTTMEDTLEGAERKIIAFVTRYTNGYKQKTGI